MLAQPPFIDGDGAEERESRDAARYLCQEGVLSVFFSGAKDEDCLNGSFFQRRVS